VPAFVDGNKRTAFVTALTLLRLNGFGFRADPIQDVRMMEDLASGGVTVATFAAWLQERVEGLRSCDRIRSVMYCKTQVPRIDSPRIAAH
jgi:prophage maintenance system killer protein